MRSDLEGRAIFVSGASGGIGAEIARHLSQAGASPFLHSNSNPASVADLLVELRAQQPFGRVGTGQADLRSEESVASVFERFAQWSEHPYGLVVNAGIWPKADVPIHRMSLERWRETLDVNLTGAFLCCREFLRLIQQHELQHAAIVLIGSTAGLYGEENHADYAASKAALSGLMLSLKNEIVRFAPHARINLVHPGWVVTPMAEEALQDPELVKRVTSTMALRKVAQPADVAAVVTFLLSERLSGHLTGVALPVAGGMEGRLLHTE